MIMACRAWLPSVGTERNFFRGVILRNVYLSLNLSDSFVWNLLVPAAWLRYLNRLFS